MSIDTKIEWTDATWNPLRGCRRVSPGCVHCYAETVAARFSDEGQPYHGLAVRTPSGPRWTGKVALVEKHLTDPLRWTRPRRVFVNSMSDLFHEDVPDEWIDRVFAVMAFARAHTFQVLTKRAGRMRLYMQSRARSAQFWKDAARTVGVALEFQGISLVPFPLPNVWLGVSVEDQQRADERIPLLLQTPAAVRFISAEPLLEGIDIGKHRPGALGLHWVIVGGESGPGARTCQLWWIRNLIGQCRDADVPMFVKQLGSQPYSETDGIASHSVSWRGEVTKYAKGERGMDFRRLRDRKGGDPSEWPTDLRVREFPHVEVRA